MKVFILLLTLMAGSASALERDYSDKWCEENGGLWKRSDVVLKDGTFPDCVTATHIVEFDFAKSTKHYEGLGQALHYYFNQRESNKLRPMLIMIVDEASSTSVKRYKAIKADGQKICPRVEVRMVVK